MKLHFCDAIEKENVKGIESERKQGQKDWIASFEKKNYFKEIKKDIKIFDWKEIIGKGLICTGFEQKGYDWKALDQ